MPSTFTAPEIRRLLELLETELAARGTAATVYVVGGAAIALSFDTGRATKDIDATLVPEDAVLEAARAVAEAELESVHGGYDGMLAWCRVLTHQLWP